MPRLNQILSTERQVKNTAQAEFTRIHHALQKPELLMGQQRTYQPKTEDGETYPEESKKVQIRVEDQIAKVVEVLSKLFDTTATKDATNCHAKADVVVKGNTLLKDVPATHLLFLEKRLNELLTFVSKLPVLDQSETWGMDTALGLWTTPVVATTKTKKIVKPLVLVQATKEHPAQVKEVSEDVVAGTWMTKKYSGALKPDSVQELLKRVEEVQRAVKYARQEANNVQAVHLESSPLLKYIFGVQS